MRWDGKRLEKMGADIVYVSSFSCDSDRIF